MIKLTDDNLALAANTIRCLAIDGVQAANSGHPGAPMGLADIAALLWLKYLKHDPSDPKWPDRDRFVLSGGHGSMLMSSMRGRSCSAGAFFRRMATAPSIRWFRPPVRASRTSRRGVRPRERARKPRLS